VPSGHRPTFHPGEHATVHAMTIHRSQGSQFEEVVVVLPGETSRLLTRELLYTAVTRATKRVHVVGSEAVIRHASPAPCNVPQVWSCACGVGERGGATGKLTPCVLFP